ncbi:MAG: hypothetical protein HRU20_32060, partial [Pseudomonadales bacterium]|nr:hypothetical protein [Pseudomonadales bacterium]
MWQKTPWYKQQLSALDSFFIHMQHAPTPMHITLVAVYDGYCGDEALDSYEQVYRALRHLVNQLPVLRSHLMQVPLGLDHPYWLEDPEFTLADHVKQK